MFHSTLPSLTQACVCNAHKVCKQGLHYNQMLRVHKTAVRDVDYKISESYLTHTHTHLKQDMKKQCDAPLLFFTQLSRRGKLKVS